MEEYSKERIQAEMKDAKGKYWMWGIASGILLWMFLSLLWLVGPSVRSLWDNITLTALSVPGLLCYRKARDWKRKYEEWKSRL